MSESFTTLQYAIITHLKLEGRATVPALAADLLLGLGETEKTLSELVGKNVVQRDGDFYMMDPVATDVSVMQQKKNGTRLFSARPCPIQAAAPAAARPSVSDVFKQARERAQREKA